MSETRLIKRYANRKLYDTQHSRYVTLDQIAEMIREGDDVKIVDNKTKEDLTTVTLAQIIFEEEKRQKSFLSLQVMKNIIQTGGESLTHLVTTAKGRARQILPRSAGKADLDGAAASTDSAAPGTDGAAASTIGTTAGIDGAADSTDGAAPGEDMAELPPGEASGSDGLRSLREVRELLAHSQQAIDEWQRKVDGRLRHLFEGLSPFAGIHRDIGALSSRIAQLEDRLIQLDREERAKATTGD